MRQHSEISDAIKECWRWNDNLSVAVLAGDQLWFYIWKKYTYCHSKMLKDPFSNPPNHQLRQIDILRCHLGMDGSP